MEEEIDLRGYVQVLLRHWKLILGLALVAAGAGFAFGMLRPTMYEAASIVSVTRPRYQIQFDPRFSTTQDTKLAYPAFPILAESDAVLQKLVDGYEPTSAAGLDSVSLSVLSQMVEAHSEGDESLVRLAVRSQSPQDAAKLANAWADILVSEVARIYGGSEADVGFFEEQSAQALESLNAADAALIEFESENYLSIIEAQLESLLQTHEDYLGAQRNISYLIQDIQGLMEQMAYQPESQTVSFADALTALLLQIKAFDSQAGIPEDGSVRAPAPIELQISGGESISDMTRAQQIDFLNNLKTALSAKSTEIDVQLLELQPETLELQRQLQEGTADEERLTRAQEIASDTYLTLARKLDEARIASQQETGLLQVGSHASVPEHPVSRGRLSAAAAAGMLGLLIGIAFAFILEHWQNRAIEQDEEVTSS
jgi:uncharacterized protein involved in exopolysaccharide biosynthesis